MAIGAGIGKITIRILPLTLNADDDPSVVAVTRRDDGCETAAMDCTFVHAQFHFHALTTGINLR